MSRYPLATILFLLICALLWTACTPLVTPEPPPILSAYKPKEDPNFVRLANGTWEPYNGPDLPHNGCDSWVVKEAFAQEGITVDYGYFPWVRSLNLSISGAWDGTLAWDDTPEVRKSHYLSAKPTTLQEWVFFYRKDHPLQWNNMDDLTGKTIGLTTGYIYSDSFKELQANGKATFIESSDDESNFRMLLAKRIDVFPIERLVGQYLIKTIFTAAEQAQITNSPNPFAQFHTYLLLSKAEPQNEQRMRLFDRGFEFLQDSGRYAEIMRSCMP